MKKVVLTEKEISSICQKLGETISAQYQSNEKPPVLICVMNGALNFTADLMKHLTIDVAFDYVQVKSWEGTKSTGQIQMAKEVSTPLDGRDVIIVEDIVDTGLSMHYLLNHLKQEFKPKSIRICALFDKPLGRKIPVKVDFVGYRLDHDEFLVGYGLDYKGLVRNVPYVFVPSEEEILHWDELTDKD